LRHHTEIHALRRLESPLPEPRRVTALCTPATPVVYELPEPSVLHPSVTDSRACVDLSILSLDTGGIEIVFAVITLDNFMQFNVHHLVYLLC
jgi:hypothetical protein